jgi:hypothetical protein
MSKKKTYTPQQIRFIKRNYLKMSGHDMDAQLNLVAGTADRLKKRLGLKVPKRVSQKFRSDKNKQVTSSTPEVDQYIRDNYLTTAVIAMAKHVGRSQSFVKTRKRQLNLITPLKNKRLIIKNAQFKKGIIPFSTGKKQSEFMSAEALERTKATRFQKGSTPHNRVNEGELRLRKHENKKEYWYLRLAKGQWVLLHKYKWEQKNGPVPAGYCLWFIDGNTNNTDPENLELITRRENYLRNSASVNLTDRFVAFSICGKNNVSMIDDVMKEPELIELKRQSIILKRTINENRSRNQSQA